MDKVLSICIASYNKSEITTNHVKRILSCSNPELEVVVVDNASTDDTVERLNKISDSRLHVIVNKENIGGATNIAKAIFEGKGRFCLYSNDRDIVYPEKLDGFIEFLKKYPEIGGGHCVRVKLKENVHFLMYQGVSGLLKMAFRDEHPTGYFFKRVLLEGIPRETIERYVAPINYATFFWENFLCEIICKGYPFAQYNDVLWESTGNKTHTKYVSGFVKMDDDSDRWFYAAHCLRRVIGNTEDVFRLTEENGILLNEEERYRLYAHLIIPEYTFGVYRNKVIHETPSLAFHYRVTPHKVKHSEIKSNRRIILEGYIQYIRTREGGVNSLEKYVYDSINQIDKKFRKTLRRYIGHIKSVLINIIKQL